MISSDCKPLNRVLSFVHPSSRQLFLSNTILRRAHTHHSQYVEGLGLSQPSIFLYQKLEALPEEGKNMKTYLGRKLKEIRDRAIKSGMNLLSEDEISQRRQNRNKANETE